jgi:voltage-gated potassium channel
VTPPSGAKSAVVDPRMVRRLARLEAYENRTAWVMVALAVVYLGIYAAQVLLYPIAEPWRGLLSAIGWLIWGTFAVDLVVRAVLSPSPVTYLVKHPIDVLAVVLPMFRFLRVLRLVTAGQWLVRRGSRLAVGRTATAVALAVTFLAIVGALAVLDAERGAEGATITEFGDAMWWAFVTMSTVGYGDETPVTVTGRVVAVAMMVTGIGLLGLVSATLASGFLAKLEADEEVGQDELNDRLAALEGEVRGLREELREALSRRSDSP